MSLQETLVNASGVGLITVRRHLSLHLVLNTCVDAVHKRNKHNNMTTKLKSVVFSGIQPTGGVHLGNYFGAISRWIKLQEDVEKDCVFSIVDLHALTVSQDPHVFRDQIFQMAATLISCGIDSSKSILFQQSQIPDHTLLSWLLGCKTTLPKLSGLASYKEKTANVKDVPLGLLSYPVLQTADILMYKANEVPVGDDNLQQIHFAQHLRQKFNSTYKTELFPFPKAIIEKDKNAARIKSLRNPEKKMSKSDPDAKSRIMLNDTPDEIRLKLRKAVTDCTSKISYDPENRPGVSNLILIDSLITGLSKDEICEQNSSIVSAVYKERLAERLIEFTKPIREKSDYLMQHRDELQSLLRDGNKAAAGRASETMEQVRQLVGIDL